VRMLDPRDPCFPTQNWSPAQSVALTFPRRISSLSPAFREPLLWMVFPSGPLPPLTPLRRIKQFPFWRLSDLTHSGSAIFFWEGSSMPGSRMGAIQPPVFALRVRFNLASESVGSFEGSEVPPLV